jgi:hypothetical protein
MVYSKEGSYSKVVIMTIFIQMAAYRDPELLLTLKDCITQAKYPENLRFGIAWQHSTEDKWDNMDEYKNDERFKIIDIDFKDSKGACWARNKLQDLYDNETYTLQLDSHHRFVKDWDEILISMLKDLQEKGYPKPLITAYIPSYNPEKDPEGRAETPWYLGFDRFIPEGAIFCKPRNDSKELIQSSEPLLGRFYSAHFAFTVGDFAKEVRHDPNYYFHGEEISIAVRAFTHGYDIFYPHKIIAWHEYTRKGRIKQWDDDKTWVSKNVACHSRNRKLFGMKNEGDDNEIVDFEEYGFGNVRTLKDYEKYAGIKFSTRSITQDVLDHTQPNFDNIKLSDEEFESKLLSVFKHCIDIEFDKIPKEIEYDFWCIAFRDENGKDMYRQDATFSEIENLKKNSNKYNICREFETKKRPSDWIVWPHIKDGDWVEAIVGTI